MTLRTRPLFGKKIHMQKDISLKQLADYNDVFAEIFNVLICGGEKVLKEEELTSVPREAVTEDIDGLLHEGRMDVVKVDRRGGRYRLIFDLEHQTGIDYTMPQRVMGYDYASYDSQIREIMEENRSTGDLAYTKRIHPHQKLAPVLTLVLYWGDDTWDSPRCLHDMLDFPSEVEHIIKPLIPDYPMNLVCMRNLPQEVREQLQTDIRLLAEYKACKDDKEKRKRILKDNAHRIRHPKEFFRAMSNIAGDARWREMKAMWEVSENEKKQEGISMCEALQELLDESEQMGSIKTMIELCKEFGLQPQEIMERLVEKFALQKQQAEEYMVQYS